jgi:hypothetical protein
MKLVQIRELFSQGAVLFFKEGKQKFLITDVSFEKLETDDNVFEDSVIFTIQGREDSIILGVDENFDYPVVV